MFALALTHTVSIVMKQTAMRLIVRRGTRAEQLERHVEREFVEFPRECHRERRSAVSRLLDPTAHSLCPGAPPFKCVSRMHRDTRRQLDLEQRTQSEVERVKSTSEHPIHVFERESRAAVEATEDQGLHCGRFF